MRHCRQAFLQTTAVVVGMTPGMMNQVKTRAAFLSTPPTTRRASGVWVYVCCCFVCVRDTFHTLFLNSVTNRHTQLTHFVFHPYVYMYLYFYSLSLPSDHTEGGAFLAHVKPALDSEASLRDSNQKPSITIIRDFAQAASFKDEVGKPLAVSATSWEVCNELYTNESSNAPIPSTKHILVRYYWALEFRLETFAHTYLYSFTQTSALNFGNYIQFLGGTLYCWIMYVSSSIVLY